MTKFEALFGIKSAEIKKNCVILPLFQKGFLDKFKIGNFKRGKLYGSGSNDDFSVIHTGVGAGLLGDAVLYLEKTRCKNIILFGSCGLISQKNGLSIGSLVSPFKCYANESFSELLLKEDREPRVFYAHRITFEDFLSAGKNVKLKTVTCATIASLKLEDDLLGSFIEKNIDAVDMECSAFFSASQYCGFKAIALFFVADIIKKKPFYSNLDAGLKFRLQSSITGAVELLCDFIKKNQNG